MAKRVKGFRFAGMHSGIKGSGAPDLGLVAADEPAVAAGVFTKNLVRAAPVVIAERRLKKGLCQAVLVNSGNANACTGKAGHAAALASTKALARELGVAEALVVPASTGVIGVQLPRRVIDDAAPILARSLSAAGASRFSHAILTTDQGPKTAQVEVTIGRRRAQLLGIAKGAGMIHPNMATTLCFVVTDAPVGRPFLRRALRQAADETFNRISVDGDTSTNDSIIALASGQAGGGALDGRGKASRRFQQALTEVLDQLGQMIVMDGEGAEHLVRVEVSGARSDRTAVAIARTVATSQLVKTAIHGCDPNWGRIVAASGRAGVPFNPGTTDVRIGEITVFRKGAPAMNKATERRASRVMKTARYTIHITVGRGSGKAHYWTCDLGHEYVRINADYRS